MKPKAQPQSKIPTTQTNTNQKKQPPKKDGMGMDSSLLKKNEFTMIIAGALAVTVLVFFLFFRTSDPDGQSSVKAPGANGAAALDQALEKRISELEVALAKLASSPTPADLEAGGELPPTKRLTEAEQRVGRLETAMTLKMDSVIGRLEKLERQIAGLKNASTPPPVVKVSKSPSKPPVKTKTAQTQKTTTEKTATKTATPKQSMFHTVQKGETLWSISQKYKTTVPAIRKLNNLTPEDKIYPGNNILVR